MAKSTSFFGLRTKSTKSLTFSTYRGQQITKDRVTSVANPQTSSQMAQRMKLVAVAAAAARLNGLVNHSFEGVEYGYKSIAEFRKLNLSGGSLSISQYVPKGMGDTGVADFIVSRGTIAPLNQDFLRTDELAGLFVAAFRFADSLRSVYPAATDSKQEVEKVFTSMTQAQRNTFMNSFLAANPTLQAGDQITFLCQFDTVSQAYRWKSKSGLTENAQTRTSFVISRIILPTLDSDGNYTWSEEDSAEMDKWKLYNETDGNYIVDNGYLQLCDLIQSSEGYKKGDSYLGASVDLAESVDGGPISAAVILSRKDTARNIWRRSSNRLIVGIGLTDNYSKCDYTYLKSTTTSKKYLNTGDTATGIIGDTTTSA